MFGSRDFSKELPFVLEMPTVTLDLDAKAKEYLGKRREQQRETTLERERTGRIVATAESEQLKQQFDLEMARRRAAFDAEMARQQAAHELEIQKMRLDVYKPMIQEGLWAVLVQQLAQNPGDIGRVTDMIMQLHNQKVSADVQVLEVLLKSDAIEDRHVKDIASSLVHNLEQNMRGGLPQMSTSTAADKRLPSDATAAAKQEAGAPDASTGADQS